MSRKATVPAQSPIARGAGRPHLRIVQGPPAPAFNETQQQKQLRLQQAALAKALQENGSVDRHPAEIPPPAQQPPQSLPYIAPVDWAIMQMRGAELTRLGLQSSDYRQIADYTAELLAWKDRDPQGLCDHYYGTSTTAPRPRP